MKEKGTLIINVRGSRRYRFQKGFSCGDAMNGIGFDEPRGDGWIGGVIHNDDAKKLRDFIDEHLKEAANESDA